MERRGLVFISYRRDDAAGHAGRLHDALLAYIPRGQLFMDVEAIGPGVDFEHGILGAIEQAAVCLILIGPRWSNATKQDGTRRLEDRSDYVRREVCQWPCESPHWWP